MQNLMGLSEVAGQYGGVSLAIYRVFIQFGQLSFGYACWQALTEAGICFLFIPLG